MHANSSPLQPGADGPAGSERAAASLPADLVRDTAEFFVTEGYAPADLLLFCPDVPGREQVMAAMAELAARRAP